MFTKGFTIIEALVALGLTTLLITLFGAAYGSITNNQYIGHRALAYNLATEEVETLRTIGAENLAEVTDAPFIGVAYNTGKFVVASHASAPSGAHVYEAVPNTITGNVSHLALAPDFEYSDATTTADLFISNNTVSNWKLGLVSRYQDAQNYYAAYLTATAVTLIKVVDGTTTTLDTAAGTFSVDTWYSLSLDLTGSDITVSVDSNPLLSAIDTAIPEGRIGLYGENGVHGYFDDLSITTSGTQTWDFDSTAPGVVPGDWKRFGINDLPGGTATVTLSNVEAGFNTLKQVTARVQWDERDTTKSVEITSYITNRP